MKTAMILAAGRGERLKPLTNLMPKAMCLVEGRPLVEHHVINLAKAGFTRIIINHAWLGGEIRHHLGDGRLWNIKIIYSPEPPGGLETGGGIFNALPLLGSAPFLTVNADIYTNFNFNSIQLPETAWAHLVLGPNPKHHPEGDFGLDQNRLITREPPSHTFLGIAMYHPKAFQTALPGRYSVVSLLHQLINEQRVSGDIYQGLWTDIGTMERLKEANKLHCR